MNWKKKTQVELDAADAKNDYTCGYEFYPWLLYMRKLYVVGFFGNMAAGIGDFIYSLCNDGAGTADYIILCFFGVFAPTAIAFLLRRDYKKLQKGESS